MSRFLRRTYFPKELVKTQSAAVRHSRGTKILERERIAGRALHQAADDGILDAGEFQVVLRVAVVMRDPALDHAVLAAFEQGGGDRPRGGHFAGRPRENCEERARGVRIERTENTLRFACDRVL